MSEASVLAALAGAAILGFAGSGHCVAMCGGLAGAFGARARSRADLAAAHAGRIASYVLAGTVLGYAGGAAVGAVGAAGLKVIAPIASGLALLALGAKLARNGRGLRFADRLGTRFWRVVAPVAQRLVRGSGIGARFAAGAAWGWLPCGMTYAALVLAAASGSAAGGAATMLAFGLGTTPALVAAGTLARRLAALQRPRLRLAAGLLLAVVGCATIASPWLLTHDGAHAGHAGHATTATAPASHSHH